MEQIKQQVLVMMANRYHMVDRSTGEINEGTTVRYIFSTDLKPVVEDNLKGYKFGKSSLAFDDFKNFTVVPGIYDTQMTVNIASDGTVKLKAENFEFVRPLEVLDAINKPAEKK